MSGLVAISAPQVFAGTSPLSAGVQSGELLFVSGQVPRTASGEWVTAGFGAQARCVLDNFLAVVRAAGGDATSVCKVNAYLRDEQRFPEFNAIYQEYFPTQPYPARTTICCRLMRAEIDVEVDGIARVPGQGDRA